MSAPEGPIVIVGAGQAGVQTAEALRSAGFAGSITLLGDEAHMPYHRPPLSKAWLAGEISAEQLVMRTAEALARKNIELRLNCTVQAINTSAQTVTLTSGEVLPYCGLALSTGSTPRNLALPGGNDPGVLPLRSRDNASSIAQRLTECADKGWPVVVIGGGFIGLELAATASKKGLTVTVLEAAPRLLGRVLAPVLSEWYAALHRSHGVTLVLCAQVQAIEAESAAACAIQPPLNVRMNDGSHYPAGLVVVGIGVSANDTLAKAAGIDCDRGIIVDASARTSAPHVVAAGDCTARRLDDGSLLRLESVQNASEQGKSAAAALLGQDRPFTSTPWFWSDQYDKKLQMAGLSTGADSWAVRGDMASGNFSVFHFRAGLLLAVDSVNATKDHLLARKLLDTSTSPTAQQAADTSFDLAGLLTR